MRKKIIIALIVLGIIISILINNKISEARIQNILNLTFNNNTSEYFKKLISENENIDYNIIYNLKDISKLQEKIKLKAEEKIKENISVKSQNTLASTNENISFKQMQAQMQFNKNQEPNNEESSKRQNDKFNVFT